MFVPKMVPEVRRGVTGRQKRCFPTKSKYDVDYSRFDVIGGSDDEASDTERQALAPSLMRRVEKGSGRRVRSEEDALQLCRELETHLSSLSAREAVSALRAARADFERSDTVKDVAAADSAVETAEVHEALVQVDEAHIRAESGTEGAPTSQKNCVATGLDRPKVESVAIEHGVGVVRVSVDSAGPRARLEAVALDDDTRLAWAYASEGVVHIRAGTVTGGEDRLRRNRSKADRTSAEKSLRCELRVIDDGRQSVAPDVVEFDWRTGTAYLEAPIVARVDHHEAIKCFNLTLMHDDRGKHAVSSISGNLLCLFVAGRALKALFPTNEITSAAIAELDPAIAVFRVRYDRLVANHRNRVAPSSDSIRIHVVDDKDLNCESLRLNCASCGAVIADDMPPCWRPPSDSFTLSAIERALTTRDDEDRKIADDALRATVPTPGRPIECDKAIRVHRGDLHRNPQPIIRRPQCCFPPRFLIATGQDHKAYAIGCSSCDADLGLAFEPDGTFCLYKHRLEDPNNAQFADTYSSANFVAALIRDEARAAMSSRTSVLLRAQSEYMKVTVLGDDGHCFKQPAPHLKPLPTIYEMRRIVLTPCLTIAYRDEVCSLPNAKDPSVGSTLDLTASEFSSFRNLLERSTEQDKALTLQKWQLAPGWRVACICRLPTLAAE